METILIVILILAAILVRLHFDKVCRDFYHPNTYRRKKRRKIR